ncbi:MAG: LysR family transcriptional regulator [Solobacterium sp.]|nr:LysR family transcriptional regulator [Solobacterium sp.]
MTITQLIYFEHVTRTLNISRTADHFQVSTPAVSRAIRDLEKEYETVLFLRDGNKLRLTPAGIVFRDNILRFLNQYHDLENTLQNAGTAAAKPFVLGTSQQFPNSSFSVLYKFFQTNYPEMNIILREEGIDAITRLRLGTLDGATFMLNENDPAFDFLTKDNTYAKQIGTIPMHLYCHEKLFQSSDEEISAAELSGVPIITVKPNDKMMYHEEILYNAMEHPNILAITAQTLVAVNTVQDGSAAVILPEFDYHFSSDIGVYTIREFSHINVYFLYQEETDEVYTVMKALQELYTPKNR